jgi:hypothetical protein
MFTSVKGKIHLNGIYTRVQILHCTTPFTNICPCSKQNTNVQTYASSSSFGPSKTPMENETTSQDKILFWYLDKGVIFNDDITN